jgi:hypothetical protein
MEDHHGLGFLHEHKSASDLFDEIVQILETQLTYPTDMHVSQSF